MRGEGCHNKIKNFIKSKKVDELKKVANRLAILLKKKFPSNNFKFKINELLLSKTIKKFEESNEHQSVYTALLKLAGKEHFYKGNLRREIKKEENMIALFFRPEKLYEWIVYDSLLMSKEFYEVFKDDKDKEVVLEHYSLLHNDKKEYETVSKPDILIRWKKGGKLCPIDAKWKILSTKKDYSDFDNDVSKLRRDAKIRDENKGYLIFPKRNDNSPFNLNVEYNYSFDDFKFEFRVINVE